MVSNARGVVTVSAIALCQGVWWHRGRRRPGISKAAMHSKVSLKRMLDAAPNLSDTPPTADGDVDFGSEVASSRRNSLVLTAGACVGAAIGFVNGVSDVAHASDLGRSRFSWLAAEQTIAADEPLDAIFSRIEDEAFSLNFIIYISRFLLNFDEGASSWWQQEVEPTVPQQATIAERASIFRKRFAGFAASVEFGLRRYLQGPNGRLELLNKLVREYGTDQERRRHLALAFTLLEEQPQRLIADLLAKGDAGKRLIAAFSPALPDYLDMDPRRLLPGTQYPVWDGGLRRWVVRGLSAAQPPSAGVSDEDVVGSIFGPRSSKPMSQERRLGPADFALFAVSGAAGCSFTHSLVIPLDVVKTRIQTEPSRFSGNLLEGAGQIQRTEGWQALLLGWQPTLLGYLYYGITVYPGYEFFKRLFITLAGPALAASFRAPLVLLAGASATVIACLGVCPAEAIRIRMVADSSLRGQGLAEVLSVVSEQDGLWSLYDGFSTILVRQVLFGMMKFLVFDYFGDFVLDLFPELTEQVETQLFVSLLSGAVAGVVSSIVSQPADTVLSKLNQEGGRKSFLGVAGEIYSTLGLGGFFLGLGSRSIWAGCIISGQFFLYDVCKSLLGMQDLRIFLDVQI